MFHYSHVHVGVLVVGAQVKAGVWFEGSMRERRGRQRGREGIIVFRYVFT